MRKKTILWFLASLFLPIWVANAQTISKVETTAVSTVSIATPTPTTSEYHSLSNPAVDNNFRQFIFGEPFQSNRFVSHGALGVINGGIHWSDLLLMRFSGVNYCRPGMNPVDQRGHGIREVSVLYGSFKITDVAFEFRWGTNFPWSANTFSTFNSTRVGYVSLGADGKIGGDDDIIATSSVQTLVALAYIGTQRGFIVGSETESFVSGYLGKPDQSTTPTGQVQALKEWLESGNSGVRPEWKIVVGGNTISQTAVSVLGLDDRTDEEINSEFSRRSDGNFDFSFNSFLGYPVLVESSTDLITWEQGDPFVGTGSLMTILVQKMGENGRCFVRLKRL